MILTSASRAAAGIFSPEIRGVFWKVLGLTVLALAALWLSIRQAFVSWVMPWIEPWFPGLPDWAGWLAVAGSFIWAVGLAAAVAMLIAPVSAIVAGFFLDDAAEIIEGKDYPDDRPGVALPLGQALASSLRFFLVVIAANLLALVLLLVPGVNIVIFFVVNGYLIGREYFEFAASRHLGVAGAKQYRRVNQGTVILAGMLVGLLLLVPVLNLLTPLFAAVLMVHLFKAMKEKDAALKRPAAAVP
ncbi:sulfate transporter family protein [Rhizobium sp. KVB221]|uniref:Sulfate transporter family protein n=1 Tax=Rhizobium setariae TaxID=2801340 RepID=A0A936YQ50_9HYPH|nr:sulfate transporter family protein [Rhizobium setariae]MBL0370512.1 sulfate transporter family protein [Rhizobium setariae]